MTPPSYSFTLPVTPTGRGVAWPTDTWQPLERQEDPLPCAPTLPREMKYMGSHPAALFPGASWVPGSMTTAVYFIQSLSGILSFHSQMSPHELDAIIISITQMRNLRAGVLSKTVQSHVMPQGDGRAGIEPPVCLDWEPAVSTFVPMPRPHLLNRQGACPVWAVSPVSSARLDIQGLLGRCWMNEWMNQSIILKLKFSWDKGVPGHGPKQGI